MTKKEFFNMSSNDMWKEYKRIEKDLELYKRDHNDLDWYKKALHCSEETIHEIVDIVLGETWYACDTGNLFTVNPIIVEAIREKMPKKNSLWNKIKNFFKVIYECI